MRYGLFRDNVRCRTFRGIAVVPYTESVSVLLSVREQYSCDDVACRNEGIGFSDRAVCDEGDRFERFAVEHVFDTAVFASGADAGGFLLFSLHPIITILICLCKSTLAGHLSGLVAEGLSKRNLPLGVFLAALTAPIVNTGLFLLGLTLFFRETLSQWAAGSRNLTSYILFGLVGVNFLIELGVNIVLAPVIIRIVHAAHQMKNQEEI